VGQGHLRQRLWRPPWRVDTVTSWGAILIAAFLVLGLSRVDESKAQRAAIALIALVVAAVGLGVL
jgi:hypothetical protein